MIFLVYCIVSLFYDVFCCPPALRDIFRTDMTRYSLSTNNDDDDNVTMTSKVP